jgi:hypothetical protein
MKVRSVLAALILSQNAIAGEYDFQISQLGDPASTPSSNANFRAFARQLGAAISSVNLSPPSSLGHSGFAFAGELSVVDFGTNPGLPTQGEFRGPLLIPSFHVRKGLPFSFELGARAGWIQNSRMGVGTVELKWAVNEGFAFLPDVAVKGSITKLLNSRDFDLTVGGLDLAVGKKLTLAGMMTFTPYIGWNLAFVGAASGTVDFRPTRTLAESDLPADQFQDFSAYQGVLAGNNSHNRFYGGLRVIAGIVQLGGEVSYAVIGKFSDSTGTSKEVPGVLAGNFMLGLDF